MQPATVDPEPEADEAALAEARADFAEGRYVSWEAVKRWMQSWGTANELPPPKIGD